MYPEKCGNQEANIHSWKIDHNFIFPNKRPAVFWHHKKGGYPQVRRSKLCHVLLVSYICRKIDYHMPRNSAERQEKSRKTSELLKETGEICPHVKAMTHWQVLVAHDITMFLKINSALAEISYFECQMCRAGEHSRGGCWEEVQFSMVEMWMCSLRRWHLSQHVEELPFRGRLFWEEQL